jgi:phosphoribosylformimino-5-aminoimidazole carboxamide ribotide isomerase
VLPAIDLLGGRCVRLRQGDYAAETVYDDDPVRVARQFEVAGARWIHVVDLDAARSGEPVNRPLVEAIVGAVSCRVEASGGVRDASVAGSLLDAGVARVVVGTAAVEHPELVAEVCAAFPDRIAVGLDARGSEVAVRGWTVGTGLDLLDVLRRFDGVDVSAFVVTQILRDGTFAGPDLLVLAAVLESAGAPVIASGGVGSLDDLRALAALGIGRRRLAGAIVGTAIYEGRFTLADALAVVG